MLTATVARQGDAVTCQGLRHAVRVRRDDRDGGLRVEAATLRDRRWSRVDHDPVALTRTATRLLTLDPDAAHTLVAHAIELAQVPARDTHPVTGLVRAVHPLLATPEPWPLAGLPDTASETVRPVLRARDPRTAARHLVGDRATRPVARALAGQLTARGRVDVLLLEVVAVAAPLLQPDHLARLLGPPRTATTDLAPLGTGGVGRLRALLVDAPPRRVLAMLEAAVADDATRRRVRFVAASAPPDVELDAGADWATVALDVALGGAGRA